MHYKSKPLSKRNRVLKVDGCFDRNLTSYDKLKQAKTVQNCTVQSSGSAKYYIEPSVQISISKKF